ncbi:c-type cytochrome [Thiothrix litoralis]|jgi:cytochrome c peroxidase|uniref:C-type cytochrome n=1 Tax=Thiothrix litoralis TaxID=2891210 RepID=A0ABX7WTG0_9GAMM|nr:cytochrome c peroxidase [Thiothrix litoralis]QTR46984.1 c-type cytochrome [Thiothrix litoralis]
MKIHSLASSLLLATLCSACGDSSTSTILSTDSALASKEALGQKLFFDTNLSSPAGQACASCHDPAHSFADPDTQFPTSEGANAGRFDERHTLSIAYALYTPAFHFDDTTGGYVGGQFSDGRAKNLLAQAQSPFLDQMEMANPDPGSVIAKVQASTYASLMEQVYGQAIFSEVATAYTSIADAIAAFERTSLFHPFDAKYDHYLAGKATLSTQEAYGLQLFNDPGKGNCATCHTSTAANDTPPLFTNFTYANLGLPTNHDIPLPPDLDAMDFRDYGLGGRPDMPPSERGKFKVPTLRNTAKTAPYGHNGLFKDLREVVDFHNTRDVSAGRWELPEVAENLDTRVGNLGLTDAEVDAIVAFLQTLSDGYTP